MTLAIRPGVVGVGVDGNFIGGDRRGGVDLQVVREQAAQQLDDRPRAAVVALRMQRDPAGQRRWWAPVEILHRVFQPQEPRIGPGMAEDEVAPLFGDVLALIDDDRVEQEGSANRQLVSSLLQALEGIGQGEVGCLAGMAHALVTELVIGAGQSAGWGDAVEMIRQRTVEADVERAPAGLQGGAILGKGQLGLSRAGGAGDPQAKRLELKPPCPMCETAGNAGDHIAGMAHQGADVGVELDQVAQEGVDLWCGLRFLAGRQKTFNDLAKLVAPAGIDDAFGNEAGGFRVFDCVVRAVRAGRRYVPRECRHERRACRADG